VQLGYAAASGVTFVPGVVSDGLSANSTSSTKANAVFIGGDAGSQVNLAQANTYTGPTTINANATGEAQNASALGTTENGTVVSNNAALKLYSGSGISFAAEPLTLNGLGVSGVNGALRSVGGTNTWNGPITLGSNSRINADTTGGAGALTLAGNVAAGANVLYLGANGAAISATGTISGAGATQDGTITSIFKDGTSNLTLSAANSYTGDTRIAAGTLTAAASATVPTCSCRVGPF
jgi:autotransporter-associated beta strand protein